MKYIEDGTTHPAIKAICRHLDRLTPKQAYCYKLYLLKQLIRIKGTEHLSQSIYLSHNNKWHS